MWLSITEDAFNSSRADKMIKLGTHENLELKLVLQKRFFKNISLILVQNGQTENEKSSCRSKISQS
jgi:hypothetical protein